MAEARCELLDDRARARVVQAEPQADGLVEAEHVNRHLAGKVERQRIVCGGVLRGGEQQLLRNQLEAHLLEVSDAVPVDGVPAVKDPLPQLLGALVPRVLEGEAALRLIGLAHEHDRLAPLHGAPDLAQAVAAGKVALGQEHEH